jgi:hypothetical protein
MSAGKNLRYLGARRSNMKKQLLISLVLAAATAVAFGQGQFSTSTGGPQIQLPKATPAPTRVLPGPVTEGAVQVAIRTGNPIQLLNPGAPARYGTAHEHVTHDPDDPGKPKGIVLFALTF